MRIIPNHNQWFVGLDKKEESVKNQYKQFIVGTAQTPTIDILGTLPLFSIKSCFDKAFEEVITPKTCTQIMASYKYDETSIFGTLPKELISYIFEINNQVSVPHFDAFHNKLEFKRGNVYMDFISHKQAEQKESEAAKANLLVMHNLILSNYVNANNAFWDDMIADID